MVVFYRKINTLFLTLVVLILAADCGCFNNQEMTESDERIYATVNKSRLTESELKALVPKEFFDNLIFEQKKEILKEWVDNELFYQESLRLGIDKEPEIARILRNSKRDLLSAEILERRLAADIPSGEEELMKYYKEYKDYFILQIDEYRIRFSLFDNIKDARSFWGSVKKGESFSSLARKQSLDPSAKVGGRIGIVNEETVEPAMWTAIVNTFKTRGISKISDPFSVIDGFGILIIDEFLKKGTIKPFKDVREQVSDIYMTEKRQKMKKSFLLKLAKEAEIEYSF